MDTGGEHGARVGTCWAADLPERGHPRRQQRTPSEVRAQSRHPFQPEAAGAPKVLQRVGRGPLPGTTTGGRKCSGSQVVVHGPSLPPHDRLFLAQGLHVPVGQDLGQGQ